MRNTEKFTLTLEGPAERKLLIRVVHDHYNLQTLQNAGEESPEARKLLGLFKDLTGGFAPREYEKLQDAINEIRHPSEGSPLG